MLKIKSKKQHIRIWYEMLNMCLGNDLYKTNLNKSRQFYEEWGDVSIDFEKWWNDKKYLFDDLEVREITKVNKHPNLLNISIPINQSTSVSIKKIKKLIEEKKSEGRAKSKYAFDQKIIRGVELYSYFEIYKIYLKLNKPPINRAFLLNVRNDFDNRPKSKLKTLITLPPTHYFQTYNTNSDFKDSIRVIRRSIKWIEGIINKVSLGKFL